MYPQAQLACLLSNEGRCSVSLAFNDRLQGCALPSRLAEAPLSVPAWPVHLSRLQGSRCAKHAPEKRAVASLRDATLPCYLSFFCAFQRREICGILRPVITDEAVRLSPRRSSVSASDAARDLTGDRGPDDTCRDPHHDATRALPRYHDERYNY